MRPALGSGGAPASWERAGEGVELHRRDWGDARWSFLYGDDTRYATPDPPPPEQLVRARRGARRGDAPSVIQGPMMKPPVWTWEIPLYFWFGGIAAGASFV